MTAILPSTTTGPDSSGAIRNRPGLRGAAAATFLLALGPASAWSQSDPQPAPESAAPSALSRPMRVTTDTPEYCEALAGLVRHAEHEKPPPAAPGEMKQVQELATEGHRMCADGLIRSGLVRLRRALLLLRDDK